MWFFLALLAGLLFASNRLIVRLVLRQGSNNPIAFMAAHNLLAGLLLVPVALFHPTLPGTAESWMMLGLATLLFFFADLFTFLALERLEASLYQIVGQLRHVIVLFGAFLFFQEPLLLGKLFCFGLLMLGVAVALMEKSKLTINKGIIYAFVSAVFISLGFLAIKQTLTDISPIFSASFSLLVAGILSTLLLAAKRQSLKEMTLRLNHSFLYIAALIFAVFELALFSALATGEASRVTLVTQSSLLFTLLGGYIFLGERDRLRHKAMGGLMIAMSIVFLYFV